MVIVFSGFNCINCLNWVFVIGWVNIGFVIFGFVFWEFDCLMMLYFEVGEVF